MLTFFGFRHCTSTYCTIQTSWTNLNSIMFLKLKTKNNTSMDKFSKIYSDGRLVNLARGRERFFGLSMSKLLDYGLHVQIWCFEATTWIYCIWFFICTVMCMSNNKIHPDSFCTVSDVLNFKLVRIFALKMKDWKFK